MIETSVIMPELTLMGLSLLMLLYGLFMKGEFKKYFEYFIVLSFVVTIAIIWQSPKNTVDSVGVLSFKTDLFALTFKTLILLCSIACVWLAQRWFQQQQQPAPFEYYILIMLSTLGMMIMVSADSLLMLYIGLELQSLALYVMTAIRRDDARASEAGLKYFVLGALASGILLYGLSLLYGSLGSLDYSTIALTLGNESAARVIKEPLFLFGLVFTLSGFAFKISAAPFHMWTPDVYQGAPTAVTAFLASAPKIAAIAMIIRFLAVPFADQAAMWQHIIIILAVASMAVGAFTAIMQTNIKRLLAYSSIGHMGYVLVGIAAGTQAGYSSVLYYMMIYSVMIIGVFAALLMLNKNNYFIHNIDDLAGLSKTHPIIAFALAALFLSLAGIPPLAGFFGKFYVFQAALAEGLYALAIAGVLSSVVAAYYYLRLCKVMYFDDVVEHQQLSSSRTVTALTTVSATFVIVFFFFPAAALYDIAVAASLSLVP